MPRRTDEEQADFQRALGSVAEEEPLTAADLDALSVLEGGDLQAFRQVWAGLSAPARARLVRGLRGAAEERLRLDFSSVNQLALDDPDERVRLAGVECALEDRSPALLDRLVQLVRGDSSAREKSACSSSVRRGTFCPAQ